ncbi:folylpolyglutamate synthase/dihydrofolate synthase family protein [Halothiobacillus sp. 15-55-196]|uniref:bifunctional folylpolyglutamate synthase/dihydrofolate synthase n=1 Tax=Halothiobacillus sp. 15-55-196 TaxID=1970382 RepID=UPI0025C64A36|nr:folylpolyglutamate synthase/dihydrofolate synthase family protein [Halothiobacillus sp. 15-55-196]
MRHTPAEQAPLPEWLSWLEARNPARIDLGLDRVAQVWRKLKQAGNLVVPKVITVAGTNGKGSSVALLEAILLAEGYRVGAYTSPHIERFNERIRLMGADITDHQLVDAMHQLAATAGSEALTYYEWATLAAFLAFCSANLDIWILEVGLGGRLDAVNILDADLALITNIGLDHQAYLGDTRAQIGYEKAGVLRKGQPAVYADPDPIESVIKHANAIGCPLFVRGRDFMVEADATGWRLGQADQSSFWPLPGMFGRTQVDNAAGVVALLQHPRSPLCIGISSIEAGIRSAKNTGRFEIWLHEGRQVILDVAHNLESVRVLLDNLHILATPSRRLAVFGALDDKPIEAMISLCRPNFDEWYLGQLDSVRSASIARLSSALDRPQIRETSITSAYNAAFAHSAVGDQLIAFGSFYTVSAIRHVLSQSGAHLV